jgi:uncharacterized protein
MRSRDRFVFDTNVLVRAVLLSDSKAAEAFRKGRQVGEILSSRFYRRGVERSPRPSQFDRYISREDRERFLVAFLQEATLVEITEQIAACRDPKDDKFLELAVCGGAACIVTADDDLLTLHPFGEFR